VLVGDPPQHSFRLVLTGAEIQLPEERPFARAWGPFLPTDGFLPALKTRKTPVQRSHQGVPVPILKFAPLQFVICEPTFECAGQVPSHDPTAAHTSQHVVSRYLSVASVRHIRSGRSGAQINDSRRPTRS
jgi:hypothetical protein